MFVVEVDSPKGASRRTHADAVAVNEFGVAEKIFSVNGKSVGVLVERLLQLLALVEFVDLVFAGTGGVGAGAK